MDKQDKKALVPRLRFPEFRDSGEWKEKSLGDCLDYKQPTEYLVSDTNYNDAYGIPVLTAGKTFVLGYTNEKHGIFSEGLPVIIFDDFTTATQFVDFPFKAKSSAMKILQAKPGTNIKFMYEVMQMVPYQVGVHERHWISRFSPIKILAPRSEEQQKIADCLTSLDEVIAAENQKLETLKTYKKGLMQQLFPREGETVPRLRFPEFRNAPDWEKKQLAELGEIITGKTPSTTDSDLWGGDVLFITPTDIDEDGKYQETSQRTVVATTGLKLLPTGSIAYTCIASIGKLAITVHPSITNQQINSIVARPDVENEFIYYAMVHLTPSIKSIPATSTLPIINKTDFSKIKIWIPADRAEQKAIADCLASIDDLIITQSQEIDALKTHKKGLMQQLFPVLDEVFA